MDYSSASQQLSPNSPSPERYSQSRSPISYSSVSKQEMYSDSVRSRHSSSPNLVLSALKTSTDLTTSLNKTFYHGNQSSSSSPLIYSFSSQYQSQQATSNGALPYSQDSKDLCPKIKEEVESKNSRPSSPDNDWSMNSRSSSPIPNHFYQEHSPIQSRNTGPLDRICELNASLEPKKPKFGADIDDLQLRQYNCRQLYSRMANVPIIQPSSPGIQQPLRPRPIISTRPSAWQFMFSPLMPGARFAFPQIIENPFLFNPDYSLSTYPSLI